MKIRLPLRFARCRHNVRRAAFTLTEALTGAAVMGIVFVSLYAGMASGFQSIRASQENLRATQIMIEKFESLRLYNWEQINTPGFVPENFTAAFSPNEKNQGITYNGKIRIGPALTTEPYTIDLRSVTITLTWKSQGMDHTRTLTSNVARFGLQNYVF